MNGVLLRFDFAGNGSLPGPGTQVRLAMLPVGDANLSLRLPNPIISVSVR